jgi:hypothetical protein
VMLSKRFPTKLFHALLVYHMHSMCPAHHKLCDLIQTLLG